MSGRRVKIVNDIRGHTTVVETPRDRGTVYFGLAKIVKHVNRRRDDTIRMSLSMLEHELILHVHCQLWWGNPFAAATLDITEPLREAEAIIWGKGGVS